MLLIALHARCDPFGAQADRRGDIAFTVGYQGVYTDPARGLVDMGARSYQPATATLVSRDTSTGALTTRCR